MPPEPLARRFSRLPPTAQIVALRDALAWQQQGLTFTAALALTVRQVELASLVKQMRQPVTITLTRSRTHADV